MNNNNYLAVPPDPEGHRSSFRTAIIAGLATGAAVLVATHPSLGDPLVAGAAVAAFAGQTMPPSPGAH